MMTFLKKSVLIFCMSLSTISCALADDKRVTMKNVEEFKAEFSSKLPVGTPKDEVISYLESMNISFTYLENKKNSTPVFQI